MFDKAEQMLQPPGIAIKGHTLETDYSVTHIDRQRLRELVLLAYEMCGTMEKAGVKPSEYGEFQSALQRFWYAKK